MTTEKVSFYKYVKFTRNGYKTLHLIVNWYGYTTTGCGRAFGTGDRLLKNDEGSPVCKTCIRAIAAHKRKLSEARES